MNLACKNALLRRDVAHLIFPDEVQTLPAGGRRGRRRARGPRRAVDDRAAGGVDRRLRSSCSAAAQRPVIIVGHGARDAHAAVIRARRAARRAGDHDVQGQGPDRRRPSARRRRARPQRHAGRELGDERGRPAARARRVVLQPHRHLRRAPDHPGRLRPDAARQVPPGRRAGLGRGRRRRRAAPRGELPNGRRPDDQAAQLAERWAIWRAEKASRAARRPRPRRELRRRCSRRWSGRSPTTR